MKIKGHTIAIVLFFVGAFLFGISIYHSVEGWGYLDSTYFLVITATTIGYGDLVPQTNVGKIVTMVYSIMGIAFFFYMISVISHYVFERKLRKVKHVVRKRK
jgi:voltage-gated potassium channel